MALLAIDAGTGSVRAVAFATDGRQLSAAGREWEHHPDPRYPGSMDFAVDRNYELVCQSIREALSKGGLAGTDVEAVSATSMREGIVVYDADGNELWACANVDARSAAEVSELRERDSGSEARAYAESGQTFALSAQPRLRWLQKNMPDSYARADSVEMLSDWVLTRLCGVRASDPSNGCTSGIFSLEKRDWSHAVAQDCGLRTDIFPPVHEPGTVIGEVIGPAAAATGLAAGTPVVTGGGDAQLAAAALGVVAPAQTCVSGGTFWQQMVNLREPRTDPEMRIRVNCHAVPEQWQAEGIAFIPGLVVRWFRDVFGAQERAEAERKGVDPYEILIAKAATVPPGSYGVIPVFSDVMNYREWIHAAPSFLNLTLDAERSGPHVLFRSLLENAAIVSRGNLEAIRSFTGTAPEEIVFAGGAAKSSTWAQIVADVLQVPVRIPVVKEATALGAALCAGVGIGKYRDIASAGDEVVRWERTLDPVTENAAVYDDVFGRWRESYRAQLGLARAGVVEPMWRAPGI